MKCADLIYDTAIKISYTFCSKDPKMWSCVNHGIELLNE